MLKAEDILFNSLCELFEWQEGITLGGRYWCCDDKIIHSKEELCEYLFNEIRIIKQKKIELQKELILLKYGK
ncbi:MAG TPA: hypothetical protein VF849_00175 [Blattabacteriaceae bacterium]